MPFYERLVITMNILSLDVGTTSMRGILYDENGATLATASVDTPLVYIGSYIEQTPKTYLSGIITICKSILTTHTIDAISLTSFRSAICLVDEQCNELCNFIMWQDVRNKDICASFEQHADIIKQKSGAKPNTVFTATRLLWLKNNAAETYNKAFKAVIVPDYIMHFMVGKFVTDRSYGSRTHLMNISTLEWDDSLFEIFSLDKRLACDLIDQGTVAGLTTSNFSKLTGVREGIPVISAGGDQQCGALGLGVLNSDTLEVNCGTGSFVISVVNEPVLEGSSLICNVSAIRGKYTVESNVISSASAVNWFVREFYPEYWKSSNFKAVDEIVENTGIGSNGLFCIPHFQGCGTRDWNANSKAAFWGYTLSTTRADMARALYEGITSEIAKSINALPESCRLATKVNIAGGLTKSNIFNTILCNMLNRQLVRFSDPQATAIGAFVSAAVELGVFSDHAEALNAVRKLSNSNSYQPNSEAFDFYKTYIDKTERIYKFGLDN